MKNELFHIIQMYFSKSENPIYFYGDESRIAKLGEILGKLEPFDHPEAYAVLGKEVLIFEHFEFDSSHRLKRRGSQQRCSQSADDRAFASVLPTEKGSLYHGAITADYTVDNYRENLKQVFCKHYNEIPGYKATLREHGVFKAGDRASTIFFIEDTTIFGNIFETDNEGNNVETLVLPRCDFFLDLFESSPDLDAAICASQTLSGHCLWYIDRTMINEYRIHAVKTEDLKIINFRPQSLGVRIIVPEENLGGIKTIMREHI